MRRILFLSYYFAPCNATASNRPNSFVKNFIAHNFHVTVVTRHWTGNEKVWNDYLRSDQRPLEVRKKEHLELHYLPYEGFNYRRGLNNTLFENLRGNFNYELAYGQFEGYVRNMLKGQSFDFIIASTPPLTVIKTAERLAKEFSIPLIVDIRDFENDILLYKEARHGWLRQQQHNLLRRFFGRWMRSSSIIFTASPPLTDYVADFSGKEVFTLNNGFNEELLQVNEPLGTTFTVTVTGTLYELANLQVMLDTFRLFFARYPAANAKFQFIGLLANQKVADMIRAVIPAERLEITHRISQSAALHKASASHVLLLAGFDEMKGAYTTKIFEYLGLRRNILQIPGDSDVVEELIHHTKTGAAPHSAEEACTILKAWLDEWENNKHLAYNGDLSRIMEYSRENQFKKLLSRLG